ILGKQQGFDVFVSDKGAIKDHYKKDLEKYEIAFEEKQHTREHLFKADLVIKSPGIPDKVAVVKELREVNKPIISEIEFASRYTNAFIIAITGSNGKTTTTTMTYEILKEAGFNVGVGGNIGDSFAKQVAIGQKRDYYVLEVSSFQLDDIVDFKPNIAIITNVTPDHLDRYDYDFGRYTASKFRIAMNQTKKDSLIFCKDDETSSDWVRTKKINATLYSFTAKKSIPTKGAYTKLGWIYFNEKAIMPVKELSLKGEHNLFNAMASGFAAYLAGVKLAFIRLVLSRVNAIEHRMEFVANVKGVDFINDTKATNVDSVWYALDAMTKPIVWVVGGQDKGNDYSSLIDLVKEKVKAIVCLGADNRKIREVFGGMVSVFEETNTADKAVNVSFNLANEGDVVLLSPACTSFDLFDNYAQRGVLFKEAVRALNKNLGFGGIIK
ncbi:MAG: UDP-N-acetylmuramoyl-L-alanine--D-glutamate ligase, partial [Chitinophagales bacterium]